MVNFALQTRKTSPNHDFFIKNQAKSLIFHGFPCQNFPTVNRSSRHAYRGADRPPKGRGGLLGKRTLDALEGFIPGSFILVSL